MPACRVEQEREQHQQYKGDRVAEPAECPDKADKVRWVGPEPGLTHGGGCEYALALWQQKQPRAPNSEVEQRTKSPLHNVMKQHSSEEEAAVKHAKDVRRGEQAVDQEGRQVDAVFQVRCLAHPQRHRGGKGRCSDEQAIKSTLDHVHDHRRTQKPRCK